MVETIESYLDELPQISLSELDGISTEKIQQALNIIWHIVIMITPDNGIVRLKVPSYRLVELCILSAKAALVIEEHDSNIITLERKDDGIEIIETYREGSTIYNVDSDARVQDDPPQLRRDRFTIERLFLTSGDSSQINAQVTKGALHPHYHDLVDSLEVGNHVVGLDVYKPEMKPVPTTSKALNTTIALLIEGTREGRADKYFNSRRA